MKPSIFAAASLAALLSSSAFAQFPVDAATAGTWPTISRMQFADKVYLITAADPKHRQTCRVEQVLPDQVTCRRHFGRAPVVYHQADVLAVINPAHHATPETVRFILIGSTIAAGIICAAVVPPVPIAVAVGLDVLGGFVEFVTFGLAGFADDSTHGEMILYLRPDTQLTLPLRA